MKSGARRALPRSRSLLIPTIFAFFRCTSIEITEVKTGAVRGSRSESTRKQRETVRRAFFAAKMLNEQQTARLMASFPEPLLILLPARPPAPSP